MENKAAARLRLIGVLVVLAALMLLWLPVMSTTKLDYSDAIASTIAIGIGLLLLAEIGPAIRTLKAGGIELEFLDSVSGKFNALETRVAQLELSAKHPERTLAATNTATRTEAPALQRKITERDDPQKGRWGSLAERDGFRLSATFRNAAKNFVEIVLKVEATQTAAVRDADCVEFHLHDTFDPDTVPVLLKEGVAELSLLAYGGFTVGVWIACTQTELELDLSKIKGAPRIIRDL